MMSYRQLLSLVNMFCIANPRRNVVQLKTELRNGSVYSISVPWSLLQLIFYSIYQIKLYKQIFIQRGGFFLSPSLRSTDN